MSRAAGVAAGGALLTLVALAFAAPLLLVPAIAFLMLGAVTPTWLSLTARGARIERQLHADRVIEGEPVEATIDVHRGRLGLPGAYIEDPLSHDPIPLVGSLSVIRGDTEARIRIVARFPHRGLRRVAPPSLVVEDPLALARVTRTAAMPAQELLVLPRAEPVKWRDRSGAERRAESSHDAGGDPVGAVEIDGLRPYRIGTPASRIHWPALARGAGLLERRLHSDGDLRPLIVLDARGDAPSEQLDAAVRAAASLTLALARRRGCALLLPGGRRATAIDPDLGGWAAAHAALALVEGGPHAPAPVLGGGRFGSVFYVAVQPLEAGGAAAALGALTRHGCSAVLPRELCQNIPQRPSFEVAGCLGFAVRAGARSVASTRRVA
jgi:uncharacterized protein (DUF58 family)